MTPQELQTKKLLHAARTFAASEDGKEVLRYLRAAAGMDAPAFIARPDGHACPYLAAQADGRKSICLDLEKLIAKARAEENEEETKPQAKR
jgi:hypothetical protein